jgi:hypothetical protein
MLSPRIRPRFGEELDATGDDEGVVELTNPAFSPLAASKAATNDDPSPTSAVAVSLAVMVVTVYATDTPELVEDTESAEMALAVTPRKLASVLVNCCCTAVVHCVVVVLDSVITALMTVGTGGGMGGGGGPGGGGDGGGGTGGLGDGGGGDGGGGGGGLGGGDETGVTVGGGLGGGG